MADPVALLVALEALLGLICNPTRARRCWLDCVAAPAPAPAPAGEAVPGGRFAGAPERRLARLYGACPLKRRNLIPVDAPAIAAQPTRA